MMTMSKFPSDARMTIAIADAFSASILLSQMWLVQLHTGWITGYMFEKAGIEVIPILRGLGELNGWASIYVQHLKEAMVDNEF